MLNTETHGRSRAYRPYLQNRGGALYLPLPYAPMQAIAQTQFTLANQSGFHRGKVRDVYYIDNLLLSVTTDRVSAFDVVLPKPIPGKGAVLNLLAAHFFKAATQVCPTWLLQVPDPNVSVGHKAEPFPIKIVAMGHLTGNAARQYATGQRILSSTTLPDGLYENDPLPEAIITPTLKVEGGHEDISREQILERGLVSEAHLRKLEEYSLQLFTMGQQMARDRGLVLADTKYGFGLHNGRIVLIDEVHTPGSSSYFYAEGFEQRQKKQEPQKKLSQEFVSHWLSSQGFNGQAGQAVPDMDDSFLTQTSLRYQELYKILTGNSLPEQAFTLNLEDRILSNIQQFLNTHQPTK